MAEPSFLLAGALFNLISGYLVSSCRPISSQKFQRSSSLHFPGNIDSLRLLPVERSSTVIPSNGFEYIHGVSCLLLIIYLPTF